MEDSNAADATLVTGQRAHPCLCAQLPGRSWRWLLSFSTLECCLALLFLASCDRKEPTADKGVSPRPEVPLAVPDEQRKAFEKDLEDYQKAMARTQAYLRFEPADRSSEAFRQAQATCAPMPARWHAPGVAKPYSCRGCTGGALHMPRCKAGLKIQPITEALLSAAEQDEHVLTAAGIVGPDSIGWVGTAKRASYSTPLVLSSESGQSPRLFLLLDTENLSTPLRQLVRTSWVTQTGTLFCQGKEELCCLFDFGQEGAPARLAVTGRIRKLDRSYPDRIARVTDRAILAQSICRL